VSLKTKVCAGLRFEENGDRLFLKFGIKEKSNVNLGIVKVQLETNTP
jgi:hypothetical protein